MPSFCGKCGSPLTPEGNCPKCEPNHNPNFLGYNDGDVISFEIPGSQGNTVYAKNSDDVEDSANIPQNQPPVKYEGNVPIPSSPPVTNIPPVPMQNTDGNINQSRSGYKPPKNKSRKKNSKARVHFHTRVIYRKREHPINGSSRTVL